MTEKNTQQLTDIILGQVSIKGLDQSTIDRFISDYPYSPIGHLLNYLKAKSEDLPDQSRLLQKVATYVPDRSILEKLLKTGIPRIDKEPKAEVSSDIPSEAKDPRLDKVFFEFDFHEATVEEISEIITTDVDSTLEEATETPSSGASDYVNWLKSLNNKTLEDKNIEQTEEENHEEVTQKEPNTRTEDDLFGGIITETLAELLANQGQIDKAISMYQRLTLIFPDKSSFFAAKIDQLKEK